MQKEENKKLKIIGLGFDWRNIGQGDYQETKKKLDRDGLESARHDFLLLYAGNFNRREKLSGSNRFIVWHAHFLCRWRLIYDWSFTLMLPVILLIEKFKPDVFYLYDFIHVLAVVLPAKLCRAKIYLRLINLPTELALAKGTKGKMFWLYYKIMEKLTCRLVDKFIVINETTKKYLLDLGANEKKIILDIPDTIGRDQEFLVKANKDFIRRKFNISPEKKIILSVGSLIAEKGFDKIVQSLAQLGRDDLVLVICGQGPEEKSLKEKAEAFKISDRVILAGQVDRQSIWHYFVGADIFTLFSRSESLGMVFWEAMIAGVPVIGSPVGGILETIGQDGERGFYWQGDLDNLREKIDFCLSGSDNKKAMIESAKKWVEERLKSKKTISEIYYG